MDIKPLYPRVYPSLPKAYKVVGEQIVVLIKFWQLATYVQSVYCPPNVFCNVAIYVNNGLWILSITGIIKMSSLIVTQWSNEIKQVC